jgi:hypothetical protein
VKTSELKTAMERAKAGLMGGKDPDEVLTEFAASVGSGCSTCGANDLCFKCKLTEVAGERVVLALPFLIPKVMEMVKDWHAERTQRASQTKAKPGPRPGQRPSGPGSEKF